MHLCACKLKTHSMHSGRAVCLSVRLWLARRDRHKCRRFSSFFYSDKFAHQTWRRLTASLQTNFYLSVTSARNLVLLLMLSRVQETFKLLLSNTDSSSNVPEWRETDYAQYDVIAADHVFIDIHNATINEHTSSFAVTHHGSWIAFRDQVRASAFATAL